MLQSQEVPFRDLGRMLVPDSDGSVRAGEGHAAPPRTHQGMGDPAAGVQSPGFALAELCLTAAVGFFHQLFSQGLFPACPGFAVCVCSLATCSGFVSWAPKVHF